MAKQKVKTEKETREGILRLARDLGCEGEVSKIFSVCDERLRTAITPLERQEIAVEGVKMIELLLNSTPDPLIVGNKVIFNDRKKEIK